MNSDYELHPQVRGVLVNVRNSRIKPESRNFMSCVSIEIRWGPDWGAPAKPTPRPRGWGEGPVLCGGCGE